MNSIRTTTLTLLAAATLAACSSIPATNVMLEQARSDYGLAQASNQTQTLAPAELKQAGDALARADAAFAKREDKAQVTQLAYLSRQQTALAQEAAGRKASEAAVAAASAERDKLRLDARTREADLAAQSAAIATQDAAASQRQAEASRQQSEAAQRQAMASQQQAAASRQQAAAMQQQAGEAERRNQVLAAQLRELNAKQTDRGMVITIGDVLFDTGRAELKSGAVRNVERLGSFLKEYPQRKALIEGYTDSTGSEQTNQALSGRRAEAVMTALLGIGVSGGQLSAQGFGQARPVAGNDNAGGRQMNRRVEIVLSDENGMHSRR
ncbi:MAG: OmpA family protein, partial [Rubrivivax sp.]|nr:OmpA family protein [Rubrivivax sp.]